MDQDLDIKISTFNALIIGSIFTVSIIFNVATVWMYCKGEKKKTQTSSNAKRPYDAIYAVDVSDHSD